MVLGIASADNLRSLIGGLLALALIGWLVWLVVHDVWRRHREKRRLGAADTAPASTAPEEWGRLMAPRTLPRLEAPVRNRATEPTSRLAADPQPVVGQPEVLIDPRETPPPAQRMIDESPAGVVAQTTGSSTVAVADAPVARRGVAPARPALAQPYVTILGPVDLCCESPPDRRVVKELAVYLALHRDRPRRAEELAAVLWPTDDDFANERDPDGVHQTASRLRRCLGPDALPDATTSGGYLLSNAVRSDWETFQSLVALAPQAEDPIATLGQALSLVEGAPFSGIRTGTYGWVWSELWASHVTTAVVRAAHDLVEHALQAEDHVTAQWAARGLRASPTEEQLHEDRLRIAAAARDQAGFERTWTEIQGTLREQAESGPVGETYRQLRRQLGESSG